MLDNAVALASIQITLTLTKRDLTARMSAKIQSQGKPPVCKSCRSDRYLVSGELESEIRESKGPKKPTRAADVTVEPQLGLTCRDILITFDKHHVYSRKTTLKWPCQDYA